MAKTKKTADVAETFTTPKETVLVLRTCAADMTSYNGFKWPESGLVEAPDWNPQACCGYGLHGLLWGEGDGGLLDWSSDAKWLVCRVEAASIVDLESKVKFPRCEVVFIGDRQTAPAYIIANGASGKAVVAGTATAGDRGTATAGDSGTATAGDRGTATAGDSGTATAGDRGTATAGDSGTATAGPGGVISILRWNGKRYKAVVAHVKDEDGDGQLEPNVAYRLDDDGNFVKVNH